MELRSTIAGRHGPLAEYSKFRRLAIVHAGMMGGDAAMVVALANSFFFSIDPSEGREKVLLFLLVSFAPFLLIAPLIGPVLDRIAGGRRFVIQVVALARIVLSIAMAVVIDEVALFPLVFVALVLQKTYLISKSALVPSVVRNERDLVEANSKLGLIAGLVGAFAVLPALLIQVSPLAGSGTLVYAAAVFGVTLYSSLFLSADRVATSNPTSAEVGELASGEVQSGAIVMVILRAAVGFMFFLIAFYLKQEGAAAIIYGLAVAAGTAGTVAGNYLAPRIRARVSEPRMLRGALLLTAGSGAGAALVGGIGSLVLLVFAVNLAGATGRMGFESLVQHRAPSANVGQAFARFETRFQFAWALGGLIPVVVVIESRLGALVVVVLALVGVLYTIVWPRLVAAENPVATRSAAILARIKPRRGIGAEPSDTTPRVATRAEPSVASPSGLEPGEP